MFSPFCRAQFCDHLCKLKPNIFTEDGSVSEVVAKRKKFIDKSLQKPKNYYRCGALIFLSGENKGFSIEVKQSDYYEIELFLCTPYKIKCGDQYTILAGCDKLFATCAGKFNNVVNFRGEPHIPGIQKLFQSIEGEI